MKRFLSFFFCIISLLLFQIHGFAIRGLPHIGGDTVYVSGKNIFIPVNITDNSGIMGFKITINFDENIFIPKGVTSGAVTQNGLLNDSISVSEEGTFDVVWSATENSDIDGTLFTISFEVLMESDSEITFSVSQSDTFDEDWNDVIIDCEKMIVSFSENSQVVSKKAEVRTATEKDIILAVESVSQESDNYLEEVNEQIYMLTGTQKMFSNNEELENAYADAIVQSFITSVEESVDGSQIDAVITDSLETFNCKTIEELPDGSKEGFVRKVESDLIEYSPDINRITEKIDIEDSINAIMKLQEKNNEERTSGKEIKSEIKKNETDYWKIILLITIPLAIAFITFAFALRNKKSNC